MSAGRPPVAASVYGLFGRAAVPLAPAFLSWRAGHGKEDPKRRGERLGFASAPRPKGRLVWIHAASIGEAVSALPLCRRLIEAAGSRVLFTTGTVTSAQVLANRLPDGAIHQFVPLDLPPAIDRFLTYWDPDLAVFVESEVWPTTLASLRARATPTALVNARLSARSASRWKWATAPAGWLFGGFDVIAAQSDLDAERIRSLAGKAVAVTGNMKFDAPAPPVATAALETLRDAIGERPVFAAASTHPGEEDIIFDAHLRLRDRHTGLLTIIAPRHPERADAIAANAEGLGLTVARRNDAARPERATDIFLVDTVGELGLVYAVSTVAFCGGSLVPHGGQNPIEPARIGVPILHGPLVHNFTDVYRALDGAGGAIEVADRAALFSALDTLLADPARRRHLVTAAAETLDGLSGATGRTFDMVRPLLGSDP